jgi:hypothetical protein
LHSTIGAQLTPAVDVPIARLSASGGGIADLICGVFGSTIPCDTAILQALYLTHDDYRDKVTGLPTPPSPLGSPAR